VIRRVCGRRHQALAADAEQEVYLALWKQLATGRDILYPVSYVYRVALTTALAVVRRNTREMQSLDASDAERLPDPQAGGVPLIERARIIADVLERLDPDEARALRAYLSGFGHAEVARLFGWSESVARHRIYRTIEKLREEAGRRSEGDHGD
jgi:RNA polymerase sigma factor (sigma-70 family)